MVSSCFLLAFTSGTYQNLKSSEWAEGWSIERRLCCPCCHVSLHQEETCPSACIWKAACFTKLPCIRLPFTVDPLSITELYLNISSTLCKYIKCWVSLLYKIGRDHIKIRCYGSFIVWWSFAFSCYVYFSTFFYENVWFTVAKDENLNE